MTERERIALRERWSGRTLEDPSDAYALHNDAWAAAMEEARGLCPDHETGRALARLALSEIVADHKSHPVSKDIYSEIVVKICLLYGKLGSNPARIREKAECLAPMGGNGEEAPAEGETPFQPEPEPEPEPAEKETAVVAEAQELPRREPVPVRHEAVEPDVRPMDPKKADVFVEKKEQAPLEPPHVEEPCFQEGRISAIPRDFPRMWETPQIQINVISSEWDRSRPFVQYAVPPYPQGVNAAPQPVPTVAPPVQPVPEPQRAPDSPPAVEAVAQPTPAAQPAAQPQPVAKAEEKPPKETAKKRLATHHKERDASKTDGNNQGYLGLMIVAIVAAFGSLIALLWQAGIFG